MKLIILTLTLVVMLSMSSNATPNDYSYDNQMASVKQNTCYPKVVSSLKAATDINNKLSQEFYLNAADAYLKLANLGENCL